MDHCIKTSVGGLNGRGLLIGESFVILDALESLIQYLTSRGLDLGSVSNGGSLGQSTS